MRSIKRKPGMPIDANFLTLDKYSQVGEGWATQPLYEEEDGRFVANESPGVPVYLGGKLVKPGEIVKIID